MKVNAYARLHKGVMEGYKYRGANLCISTDLSYTKLI